MAPGIDAGDFGAWLREARAALRGSAGSRVPCGDCTGCCTSSYSIEVRPGDAAALEKIPVHSLSRPLRPTGHWSIRPNADGTCPMLRGGRCGIYAQRPQTCLDYDCRVFAAAGIEAGGADKAVINRRVREWRFRFSSAEDRLAHEAIRAAAAFIRDGREHFPQGSVPLQPLGIAGLALRAYPVFLPPGPPGSAADTARAILAA
ncbi:MAG TPA: YkgJ family cysteine cluster protein [Steroidobacteraceae bacterium]|nr:YkgJ family cysteine cluster protein [Steroidobacteraceae bacterium]